MSSTPYPPYAQQPGFGAPPPRKTGLATTALILGLLSIPLLAVCVGALTGVVALVLGLVAFSNARRRPAEYAGSGRAITGALTGGLSTLAAGLVIGYFATAGAPLIRSVFQMMQAGTELDRYAQALAAYQGQYGTLPDSIATLESSGTLPPSAVQGIPVDPNLAVVVVLDVSRSDPATWIAGYVETDLFGKRRAIVRLTDGRIETLDEGGLRERLDAFESAFEKARGHKPTYVRPLAGAAAPPTP